MSSVRFTNPSHWAAIESHLSGSTTGERFAFALTDLLVNGRSGPLVEVVDVINICDDDVASDRSGWYISDTALDRVHNRAARAGLGLIEFHNHRIGPPQFSRMDEEALVPMADYAVDLLNVPYAAAVYAQGSVHAKWWRSATGPCLERGSFANVLVYGNHLRVLNAEPAKDRRFERQLALLGTRGQAAITALRVAVVGAGGTGSHVALQLVYLGFRNVIVLDDDIVEETNLNRLVTADHTDLGALKSLVAKRRMQSVYPSTRVRVMPGVTAEGAHAELHEVDLIIGCVDHDGPRHRLNQIAIDTRTPYIDIATGVDDATDPVAVGGRVIMVRPGRPCLGCLGELDSAEVGRWAKAREQQAIDRLHGYGTGVPNPSVVYLNGLAVSAALGELAAWLSGARPPAEWLDIDLVGRARKPGTYVGPLAVGEPRASCAECARRAPTRDRLRHT